MKFSIVIPTRNRLEYLKYTITSVLIQDYQDWEIIVSDNASSDNIQSYISSLNDSRIRYFRSEIYLSVTDNWNLALEHAGGDYIILMGADDCLLKESLSMLNQLALKFSEPELIFSNGLLYIYPGVTDEFPNGHLITISNWNLWNSSVPVLIEPIKLKFLVQSSFNFRLPFSYNMQVLTLHRSFIKRLKIDGKFFHSPYPDFYAITLVFHKAERALACPYPTAIIGVSPNSFGGQLANNQVENGMEELNVSKEINAYPELDSFLLAGSPLNICWMYALRCAQKNIDPSARLKINFHRFRKLQMVEFLNRIKQNPNRVNIFIKFYRKLTWTEKLIYGPILWFALFDKTEKSLAFLKKSLNVHPGHYNYRFKKEYSSITEIIQNINPYKCTELFKP